MNTPQIDAIIDWFGRGPPGRRGPEAPAPPWLIAAGKSCLAQVGKVEPMRDKTDASWTLWLRSERGPISAFGDFAELREAGEVATHAEFEELWREYYPDPVAWHEIKLWHHEQRLGVVVDHKCHLEIDFAAGTVGPDFSDSELERFGRWLLIGVEQEAQKILADPAAYHDFLNRNLPVRKRYGKIRRMDIWLGLPDVVRPDRELGAEQLSRFEQVVSELDQEALLPAALTLARFLEYCEICYDAGGYFTDRPEPLSARQKYLASADGRHEGLLDIDPDSPAAFREWYRTRHGGGHPWEICRGGNSTHISLQVADRGAGWQLYLAGFSRSRVVETARMAIALHARKIPFILVNGEAMLRMLQGVDWVGIVPDNVTPKYCHGDFPAADRIGDFINPWFDPELAALVEAKAIWYPVVVFH